MQPNGRNPNRAAIAIERRIRYSLQVEAHEEGPNQARAIVALANMLRAIVEPAVSNIKIQASVRQIGGMNPGDSTHSERSAGGVEWTLPALAG